MQEISIRRKYDFYLVAPSGHYSLKVSNKLLPGIENKQKKRHWEAEDYGLEVSGLRAEKRFIEWRLEGSFGPLLRIASCNSAIRTQELEKHYKPKSSFTEHYSQLK
jgi:hypothetical protein